MALAKINLNENESQIPWEYTSNLIKPLSIPLEQPVSSHHPPPSIRPSDLDYIPVTMENISELRNLNSSLFPMSYQDKYYKEVLVLDSLARLVCLGRKRIGTFSCRIQAFYLNEKPQIESYLMTFGVLAPLRRLGIGTLMLNNVIDYYKRKREVKRIVLHVHTVNESAIKFYLKHGFKIIQTIPNYYRRLEPSSAHFLCLDL